MTEPVMAEVVRGSFRDPGGFVFTADGTVYRQVNRAFAEEFDACVTSGLYDDLASGGLLVWVPIPVSSAEGRVTWPSM
jgi:hypothetical protein